jgi:hypothetical protein
MKAAVFSAVIQQRLASLQFQAFDLPDKDCVVARNVLCDDDAGNMRKRIFEKWNPGRSPLEANAQASLFGRILLRLGKMRGDILLGILQDVDAETALALKIRQQLGIVIDADQNQQRIEGNGSKRVRSHAVNLSGFSFDGEHSNTSGEATHHTAE